MAFWDELSREEVVVMNHALEEAWLTGVIGDFLGHPEADGAVWMFNTDPDAIRTLIPRFAVMVARTSSSWYPPSRYNDWPHHIPMTDAEIDTALADPDTWVSDDAIGPIMLMTTDHADRLMGR